MEARYAREIAMAKRSLIENDQLNDILSRIKSAAAAGELYIIVHSDPCDETITKLETVLGYKVTKELSTPFVIPYSKGSGYYTITW